MNFYLITITRQGGLTAEHVDLIQSWFASEYEHVVMNAEPHKSGLLHVHAYVASKVKQGCTINKKLTRFLVSKCGFVMTKNTLKVQAAPTTGACNYVVKEVTADKPVTLCQGWAIADLLQARQADLKKLKVKAVQGTDRMISQDEAVNLIVMFARDEANPIVDKHSFKLVVIAMMRMGYSFARLKMAITYAEVMVRCGDDRAADDWLDMQLGGMT